jgi:catechol 2,3-dioxygenase-like lactoylglutathione lyase family enzyme
MAEFPTPEEGFVATITLMVEDPARTARFYADVFGGEIVWEGGVGMPSVVQLANTWIIANVGGGPTEDKPTVTLAPPDDPDRVDSFMNLRVADIHAAYDEFRANGAEFLTPPVEWDGEIRAYIRDPDGYLIEVGQAK